MNDPEINHFPRARFGPNKRRLSRIGPEVFEPLLPSIHAEREQWIGCLVGRFADYRSFQVTEIQTAINSNWHLDGPVRVLKKAGPFFIFAVETLADRDDLLEGGPWNINAGLLLLRPWAPNLPLHCIDFSMADLWIKIHGAPLEYMTPNMVVRLGSLLGTVTAVDRRTISRDNLDHMRIRVSFPINRPLIPGAFLRMENGEPTWIQFSFERLFKVCFHCGCVGHLQHSCDISDDQAGSLIRRRVHEARQFPHSAFWVQDNTALYNEKMKAFTNSNINRTTKLEILWSAEEIGMFEVENRFGVRTVFFVRHHPFSSSSSDEDDPIEPSEDMNDASSEHTQTVNTMSVDSVGNAEEAAEETGGDTDSVGNAEEAAEETGGDTDVGDHALEQENRHFGLDDDFEQELNEMGLTSNTEHQPLGCKRSDVEDLGSGHKRTRLSHSTTEICAKPIGPSAAMPMGEFAATWSISVAVNPVVSQSMPQESAAQSDISKHPRDSNTELDISLMSKKHKLKPGPSTEVDLFPQPDPYLELTGFPNLGDPPGISHPMLMHNFYSTATASIDCGNVHVSSHFASSFDGVSVPMSATPYGSGHYLSLTHKGISSPYLFPTKFVGHLNSNAAVAV